MNTRRIPFQFSTTDPLARQRELEKRFGLQPTCPKMYVDVNNPLSMDSKETSSPRLQHRVPIFAEGYDKPIYSSSVDSMSSVPDNKKPNVRVIPIEVEGADSKSQRHRTYSGPAGILKDHSNLASERNASPFKRFNFENLSRSSEPKPNVEPRVYNIPIQVEGADNICKSPKVMTSKQKCATPKQKSANGCSLSKSSSKVDSSKTDNSETNDKKQNDQPKNDVEVLLKKIEAVLIEFKTYESEVLEFNGTTKDKQYRYLDEMLTRCMLKLDDIDTMGNEEIRQARKNAVKKIQASIDLLESKANMESIEVPQVQTLQENGVADGNNSNDIEMQDNQAKDNVVMTSENEASSSEVKEMELSACDSKELNEVSERIVNNDAKTKDESNSKLESPEVMQNKTDVTEMEMSEVTADEMTSSENINSCDTQKLDIQSENRIQLHGTDKTEVNNVMQSEESLTSFLQQQQNSVPEIEMSEETNLNEVNPMNNTHSSEILKSNDKGIEQNEIINKTVINDVEMLDEKDETSNPVEESPVNEVEKNKNDINTSKEASEVEMIEIKDTPSKESGEKVECETIEKAVGSNSDYSEQKTDYNAIDPSVQIASVSPKDAEMEDIPSTSVDTAQNKTCNKCLSDLCKEGVKCASNHSEKESDSQIIKKELL